jgi:glycosyltransferase involved in cell wall biosynthesis
MKIAVLSSGLGCIARGIETWADSLAVEFYKRGENVTLFKGGGRATRKFERIIPCIRRDSAAARRLSFITRRFFWRWGMGSTYGIEQVTFAFNVMPILSREKFQIIHTQDPHLALFLERRKASHGAKVIFTHGTEENFEFLFKFEHVQELVPYYLDEDRRRGLPADRRWFSIPNFVDCGNFKPGDSRAARRRLDIPDDKFVILDVAAVKSAHKRIDYIIRETASLKKRYPKVFLLVAGAVTEESLELERLGRQLLGINARFLLDKPLEEMPDIYRAADIFAHGALFEMMSIAILESLASGVPVIANKNPVFDWIIGDGGRTTDINRSGNLAAAIEEYLKDPEKLAQISSAAREQAFAKFETSMVADRIIEMYKEVLVNG